MKTLEENLAALDEVPLFDEARLDEMKEAVGEETLVMLIQMLPETGQEQFDDLCRHFADGDCDGLSTSAHTLKGTASNLGAARLQAVALLFEEAARSGELNAVSQGMIEQAFTATIEMVHQRFS